MVGWLTQPNVCPLLIFALYVAGLDQSGLKTAFGISQAYDITTYDALNAAMEDPYSPGAQIYRVSALPRGTDPQSSNQAGIFALT